MVRAKDLRRLRVVNNTETRSLLTYALNTGVRYRMTKSGVMIYADNGTTVGAHFTSSDHRAHNNLQAQLKAAGIDPKGKP